MRYFSILFLLILMGCNNQNSTQEVVDSDQNNADPLQWVYYEAEEGKKNKHVVLISGDEEYRSEEVLPMLAQILSVHHGFDCTVLFAQDPEQPGLVDPNYSFNIPGLQKLDQADLMILFTRFRALPAEQMKYINDYLSAGKPLIAIRTATHAFNFTDSTHTYRHYGFNYQGEKEEWHLGFGKLVLGESWYTHHGHHRHQSTRGIIAPGAETHPILNGIEDGAMWGPTDVYGIRMPMPNTQVLVLGQTVDRTGEYNEEDPFYGMQESDQKIATQARIDKEDTYNPNDPMPPIVWTKNYQIPGGTSGTSFTSTIGSSTDMRDEEVRRLFVNAAFHLLRLQVPEMAKVDFVNSYNPSAYAFHDDDHWSEKNIRVSDYTR